MSATTDPRPLTAAQELIPTGNLCTICGDPLYVKRRDISIASRRVLCGKRDCRTAWLRRALTPEVIARRNEALRGCHRNDPRMQAGESHKSTKSWRLRSPKNVVYEFRNLRVFITAHSHLFEDVDVRWRPRPGTRGANIQGCPAFHGLTQLSPRRANPRETWKGWTWYSQAERTHNDGKDLLDRPTNP